MQPHKIKTMTINERRCLVRLIIISILVDDDATHKTTRRRFSFARELIASLAQEDDYMLQNKWRTLYSKLLDAEHTGHHKTLNNKFPLGYKSMPSCYVSDDTSTVMYQDSYRKYVRLCD